ncbi:hypothetical protein B0I21_104287 [Sphingobacterium paludis]|uniref:Uncharacterized protein n=1 Tax=Sphingobacterium paludis TaxID=1476465 RepID=A0A4R7CZD3_9SPHI|nr:hypothetical protein B0I21_104287 [Sphingobacterium paludis]
MNNVIYITGNEMHTKIHVLNRNKYPINVSSGLKGQKAKGDYLCAN